MKPILLATAFLAMNAIAADTDAATGAINSLGLDLHRLLAKPGENLCLSPYSIQGVLTMAFAGADGVTREEMGKVLHFPKGDAIHESFSALRHGLPNGPAESVQLLVANRIFGQVGYEFREPFTTLLKDTYLAPLESLDFKTKAESSRLAINQWVEAQTQRHIRDLLPPGAVNKDTRLVLANAVYLKGPWAKEFDSRLTRQEAFYAGGRTVRKVPMMKQRAQLGFAQHKGFRAVSLPFVGPEIHLLILLPDRVNGLPELEKALTADVLAAFAKMEPREVILHLPRLRFEGARIELGDVLTTLGMKSAFDQPPGSADFGLMAPRRAEEYLYVSKVVHQTFVALDEKGVKAVAATDLGGGGLGGLPEPVRPPPVEVKVDRPFFFAVQHVRSGACLFLGRVNDPAAK